MARDAEQVVVRIIAAEGKVDLPDGDVVTGKDIHSAMARRKVWRNDKEGKYVELMFDGRGYTFRPDTSMQMSKRMGEAFVKSSRIIVGKAGEDLTAPFVPFIQIVDEFQMGEQKPLTPTSCPKCREECKTMPRLARHIMEKHGEEKDAGEVFRESRVRTTTDAPDLVEAEQ